MSGYLTPMLLVTGISFANDWYNTKDIDIKILVDGGIATAILGLANMIPSAQPVTTAIAWLAFTGFMLVNPSGGNSPVQNILKITGS
jgi:hypothetical protein